MAAQEHPRVGIIGTGFMGSVHHAAWCAVGVNPVAVLVRGDHSAVPSAVEAYTDLAAFLDRVDLVDICAPSDTHLDFALAAAHAGKSTLCEKPLALTVDDGRRILEAFAAAGVALMVGHVLRFSPEYVAARNSVVDGTIGAPAVLRLSRKSFAPDRGPNSWFADNRRSGGLIFDLMIHDLDYARWVAGDVTKVYARASDGPKSHAIALLTHACGAISHVEASWAEPAPVFRTQLEIAGAHGVLAVDSDHTAPIAIKLHEPDGATTTGLSDTDLAANPFEAEVSHFLEVAAGRCQPMITPADALSAVALAEAAQRSIREGSAVSLIDQRVMA